MAIKIDVTKFARTKGSSGEKTYIGYKRPHPMYFAVKDLRSKNINVEELIHELFKQAGLIKTDKPAKEGA